MEDFNGIKFNEYFLFHYLLIFRLNFFLNFIGLCNKGNMFSFSILIMMIFFYKVFMYQKRKKEI